MIKRNKILDVILRNNYIIQKVVHGKSQRRAKHSKAKRCQKRAIKKCEHYEI